MGVLADHEIEALCRNLDHPMIEPFAGGERRPGVISYGLTSYGYDIRLDRHFKVFTNAHGNVVVDPKDFDARSFVDIEVARDGDCCIIPPNSFALAATLEYFRVPRGILCLVVGKSTYARCGIIINCTPLEPEWEGRITMEISNSTPLPAKVYAGEGIAQVLFFKGAATCAVSYKDKHGKYDKQGGLTLPKVL
jgi:dCTP deaminase